MKKQVFGETLYFSVFQQFLNVALQMDIHMDNHMDMPKVIKIENLVWGAA